MQAKRVKKAAGEDERKRQGRKGGRPAGESKNQSRLLERRPKDLPERRCVKNKGPGKGRSTAGPRPGHPYRRGE